MKKTLYLVRHATAEDAGNSPMLHDIARELTSRGIIEAARMGKLLADTKHGVDLVVSSIANRAKDTAKIFAEQLAYEADAIVLDDTIYGGGARAYLACVNALDNSKNAVILVGHNPDISFFVEYLCRENSNKEPASVSIIEFEVDSWAEVSGKTGTFKAYLSPNQRS